MIPALACLACLIVSVFYLAPASAFLFNGGEVVVSLGEVIALSVVPQLAILVAGVTFAFLGGPSIRMRVATLCSAITLLVCLQGNLLVWDYGRFDGQAIDWERHRIAGGLEMVLWLGALIASQVFVLRISRLAVVIAVASIGVQAVGIGIDTMRGLTWNHAAPTSYDPGLLRFSTEQNVLILMLDGFQSHSFDAILEEYPETKQELQGFVYFRDTLSVFPTTLMSVPAILSGQIYDNSVPAKDFLRDTLTRDSLPELLASSGFASSVVTRALYCERLVLASCTGQLAVSTDSPEAVKVRDAVKLWDVTLFRHVPHFFKRRVYRDDHKWLLAALVAPPSEPREHFHAADLRPGLMQPTDRQRASGLLWSEVIGRSDAESPDKTFKFLHFWSSHTPYIVDSECRLLWANQFRKSSLARRNIAQSRCTLKAVFEVKRRLEQLGVLDETLLVIIADHGSPVPLVSRGSQDTFNVNRAFPLLLVKRIGEKGPFSISDRPASLADLPRTVAEQLELDREYPGESLFSEPERSERHYFHYRWKHEFWEARYLPALQEFLVRGPGRAPSSWKRGRILKPPGT